MKIGRAYVPPPATCVKIHKMPSELGAGILPEIVSIDLADLADLLA